MATFDGKVALQQVFLPSYRAPFFERLSQSCPQGLGLFVSHPGKDESVHTCSRAGGVRLHVSRLATYGRGGMRLYWQHGLCAWLRQWRPDVLVIGANPRTLSNYRAIQQMKRWRRPVIGWGLGCLDRCIPSWSQRIRQRALRRYYRRFDAMIAYSTKAASDYIRLGLPPSTVFVAPNSVSTQDADRLARKLRQRPGLIEAWRKRHGLSDNPKVLFVGRLTSVKRVDDLIKSCGAASCSMELLIVGDGPERRRLEALAKATYAHTHFFGHLSGEELGLCFAAADLFVLPGSGGLAVHEAMAYGKPVIVASGDGTQFDLVRERINGFHMVPGDTRQLTRLLETSLSDLTRLRDMGRQSSVIVSEEHNLNTMVNGFLEALNSASFSGAG